MATLPSVCPLDCPDRCSLTVEVEADKIRRISGSHKNPLTAGYICKKVADFGERVHGPRRILRPARRVGPKGSGQWEEITWEEALGEIVSRFQKILQEDGGEAILPCWYGGSNGYLTGGGLDSRFWHRLGAARLERTLCASNAGMGARSVYGDLPSADLSDVGEAELVLLWGFNPHASGIHLVPLLEKVRKRGGKLIVVDPRRIPMAEKADLHLSPLPGTDVALALCLAGLAFQKGDVNRDFLKQYAEGVEEFEAEARSWTVERTAALCGLEVAAIEAAAAMYAGTKRAMLRCGWGVERSRNGSDAIRAILALPAIYGKFGERGAGYAMSASGGYKARLGALQKVAGGKEVHRSVNLSQLAAALEDLQNPPIKALFIYDCNPVATVPDQARVVRALQREDLFTVVHEQVWTDSCAFADIVLPATTFLEHEELSRSYATYLFQWSEAVIPAVGESRSNHQLFLALAEKMGFSEPELRETPRELAKSFYEKGFPHLNNRFEDLERDRVILLPHPVQFVDAFPSRPIQLCTTENNPVAGPPQYRPPPADAELPLILISPADKAAISSTCFEDLPEGSAQLLLHPEDAARRGITDGGEVTLRNGQGELRVLVRLSREVRPGVVSLPKGLWRSATRNGWTSNVLIPAHVDPVGGGACYNDARVEIFL
jgi:anaerobic selenocysteine-containing dehydrogenase